MSNILKFPIKNNVNFNEKLEMLHVECIDDLQKTDEYIRATDKKLFLRNLLIKEYNVEEHIIDEIIEISAELTSLEYDNFISHLGYN
ncbi:MAG: hypothetical protein FWF46_01180 [Oscillospiraceae bacterium]|nr:hypothetical protein [Oscillospiraceae bacterium]